MDTTTFPPRLSYGLLFGRWDPPDSEVGVVFDYHLVERESSSTCFFSLGKPSSTPLVQKAKGLASRVIGGIEVPPGERTLEVTRLVLPLYLLINLYLKSVEWGGMRSPPTPS